MPNPTSMDKRLLDGIAAQRAQQIVRRAVEKEDATSTDNLVTKALGVLQENGVYACFLFLFSRTQDKDEKIAQVVREQLLRLAAEDLDFGWEDLLDGDLGSQRTLSTVSKTICAELDPLIMTKELFEQTLIYARYGAKAAKNEGR
ncbi:MAG: hypothetical protein U9Q70_09815 [Chloroflexota bacterium]|nr:hypothetical protein [Chloroflexota bacterium]